MDGSQRRIVDEIRAKMAAIESGETFRSESGTAALRGSQPSPGQTGPARRSASRRGAPRADKKEQALDHQAAMRKIERLCSVREQASSALRERLVREGFSEEVAQTAVERAVSCGLVDDARFADVLVRSRLAAGKGCAGIARELESHGIDPLLVDSYLDAEACGTDREIARAVALLERKPPRAKNARDAAYRRLVGKGFSSSVASSAARRWWESSQEE